MRIFYALAALNLLTNHLNAVTLLAVFCIAKLVCQKKKIRAKFWDPAKYVNPWKIVKVRSEVHRDSL